MARKPTAPTSDASDTVADPRPNKSVAELLALLDLEQLEVNLFRGHSPKLGWGRVYGGQVLAQALIAANRTVGEGRHAHSLHGYFLLGGNPAIPIVYEVERLRDGGSFTTRRVQAIQGGQPIFAMIASFQVEEEGFTHATTMPDVPPPLSTPSIAEVLARPGAQVPDTMRAYYLRERPFEVRIVETQRYFGRTALPPRQNIWIRASAPLPEGRALHNALLAYASDFAMIDTALIAHGQLMFDAGMQLASLDHALWLHQPVRADAWLLYALESPAAGGSRGLTRGSFFTADGTLVASVTQEGLMRARSTAFVIK